MIDKGDRIKERHNAYRNFEYVKLYCGKIYLKTTRLRIYTVVCRRTGASWEEYNYMGLIPTS
jgi:hypothetical protein